LALAKAQPGRISFGVPGVGSAGHVLLEYMMKLADVRFLVVPYKSGGTMLTDLIAGQLDVLSNNIPDVLPHVKSNSVRALAVRDTRRLAMLPDIPTFKELGLPEVSQPLWFGLVAPAGVPAPVLAKIRAATHKAMVDRAFVDKTLAVSASISPTTGPEFQAEAAALLAKLREVVKTAGIKPD
jgi:tripartite-type tricarboxylate transporter receptor subunit TctC